MAEQTPQLRDKLLAYFPDQCQDCSRCFLPASLIAAAVVAGQLDEATGRNRIRRQASDIARHCLFGQQIVLTEPPQINCNYEEAERA